MVKKLARSIVFSLSFSFFSDRSFFLLFFPSWGGGKIADTEEEEEIGEDPNRRYSLPPSPFFSFLSCATPSSFPLLLLHEAMRDMVRKREGCVSPPLPPPLHPPPSFFFFRDGFEIVEEASRGSAKDPAPSPFLLPEPSSPFFPLLAKAGPG